MTETYFHLSLLSRNLIALDATRIISSINNNFMKDEIAMIITLNTQEALKFEEDAKIMAKREKWEERFLMKIVVYVSLILIYDATISLFFVVVMLAGNNASNASSLSYKDLWIAQRLNRSCCSLTIEIAFCTTFPRFFIASHSSTETVAYRDGTALFLFSIVPMQIVNIFAATQRHYVNQEFFLCSSF